MSTYQYYKFIYETWNIATQPTAYSEDIGETPRYPLKTFLAGGGDCEEMLAKAFREEL